jgi:hypothetical protein
MATNPQGPARVAPIAEQDTEKVFAACHLLVSALECQESRQPYRGLPKPSPFGNSSQAFFPISPS